MPGGKKLYFFVLLYENKPVLAELSADSCGISRLQIPRREEVNTNRHSLQFATVHSTGELK